MSKNHLITFEKCEKKEEHAKLIMSWRNDPLTLAMSYHQQPKIWPDFFKEYATSYFINPELSPLFAIQNDKKVGFIQLKEEKNLLEKENLTVNLSINIPPTSREQGIGTATLIALAPYLYEHTSIKLMIAEVKENNPASMKTFLKAGFIFLDKQIKHVPDINRYYSISRFIKRIEKNTS